MSDTADASEVPSTNIAVAAHRAHGRPALTAQIVQTQLTMASAPTTDRTASQA